MANLTNVTTNFFPTASETYSGNLSATISAGATELTASNLSAYATGDVVVLTIEPGTAKEATFTGVKFNDTTINQIKWTEGNTAVGHDGGVTIVDYDSATHFNMLSKGVRKVINQDGTLVTTAVRASLGLVSAATAGWEVSPNTFSVVSGYNLMDNYYNITVTNADVTSSLSKNMYLKFTRPTSVPYFCADFERDASDRAVRVSASLTGPLTTFTDDFTVEALIKPEAHTEFATPTRTIVARRAAGNNGGWQFRLESNGRLSMVVLNGANYRVYTTDRNVNVGVWSHVAATIDMNLGFPSSILINGNSVPVFLAATVGTMSSITNVGDLSIGAVYPGAVEYFDGKIADVRVWNTVRTVAQIRDNMSNQLTGSETGLVGYWKLGEAAGVSTFNDSTSNGNHLTANVTTISGKADHKWKNTEYARIVDVTYSAPNSTIKVYTGTENAIPNSALNAPHYSTNDTPYGLPDSLRKLLVADIDWNTIPYMKLMYDGASAAGGGDIVGAGAELTPNMQYIDPASRGPIRMFSAGKLEILQEGVYMINGGSSPSDAPNTYVMQLRAVNVGSGVTYFLTPWTKPGEIGNNRGATVSAVHYLYPGWHVYMQIANTSGAAIRFNFWTGRDEMHLSAVRVA